MLIQISTTKSSGKAEIEIFHDVKLLGVMKNNYILSFTLEDGTIKEVDTRYHSVFCFADRYDWARWKESQRH